MKISVISAWLSTAFGRFHTKIFCLNIPSHLLPSYLDAISNRTYEQTLVNNFSSFIINIVLLGIQ